MTTLTIRKLIAPDNLRAQDVPALLHEAGIDYHPIGHVCWPDTYPYQPQVSVALAHCGNRLLVHYRVGEHCTRAMAEADGGRVWEDSCCELFLQPQQPGPYYNLECNCGGTLLLATGEGREGRQAAPADIMKTIDRWTSLAPQAQSPADRQRPLTEGWQEWHMALVVPAEAFFGSGLASFEGARMRGNLYKCGDQLSQPHFLSFYPVGTPSPDFHRPEFFGEIAFE